LWPRQRSKKKAVPVADRRKYSYVFRHRILAKKLQANSYQDLLLISFMKIIESCYANDGVKDGIRQVNALISSPKKPMTLQ
jgi:hypothetical protein